MVKLDLLNYKESLEKYDSFREDMIKQSRIVLKSAKRMIYSLQRGEDVADLSSDLVSEFKDLGKIGGSEFSDKLHNEGAYSEACQEYVEAMVFMDFLSGSDIRNNKDLSVSVSDYLLGVGDVAGELVRRSVNAVIKGNISEVEANEKFVSDLYAQMMQFNFRNGALRKKVDGLKYAVNKIQDVLYDVKVKGK